MFTKMIEILKERDKKEESPLRIYREGGFKEYFNNFIDYQLTP